MLTMDAHCRLSLCCKNGGVLGGSFLSYGTAHHTFCHVSISASFAMQSAIRIPSRCPVPHWRALNGFPPAATLAIGTERSCCAVTTLLCPSPTSPLCFAGADLVICVRHEVICNCRSGMSSPSTTSRTVDVSFLVPARAQRVFLCVLLARGIWNLHRPPIFTIASSIFCSAHCTRASLPPFGKPQLRVGPRALTKAGRGVWAPKPTCYGGTCGSPCRVLRGGPEQND